MSRVLYRLAMPDPHTHLLEVEVRVGPVSGPIELVMPSWTPGSYLMREYARHVQELTASGTDGAPLAWSKTDKHTWRIESAAGQDVRVRYRVYANELTVRTSHVDHSHAYVNGASVFMFVRGREAEAVELEVAAPSGWRVATAMEARPTDAPADRRVDGAPRPAGALPEAGDRGGETGQGREAGAGLPSRTAGEGGDGGRPGRTAGEHVGGGRPAGTADGAGVQIHRLVARSYDELVDSPIEIGAHRTIAWEQDGIAHEYAVWGGGDVDAERIVTDTQAIIDTARAMFGGTLPYERFVFILHLVPDGRGGLEHRASCSLQVARRTMRGAEYESFIALVAHEFFHVWNGKRIRPAALGPFDYTRENYTRDLWVVEGLTTYYTDLLLVRAGLMSRERYLERLGESISRLQSMPGRALQSLEESSFDTWIRFYRPDEHTLNSQVSYYHKGALVGLLLDMEIRRATGGAKSLDDLMTLLWERYGAAEVGYPEGAVRALAEEVSGVDLGAFFAACVRGTDELDYDRALAVVGLRVEPGEPGQSTGAPTPPVLAQERRLGLRTREQQGRLVVTHVLAGTPAHAAGVNVGDELVALDGRRATQSELEARLAEEEDGAEVTLDLLRRDEMISLRVRTAAAVTRLRVVERPTDDVARQAAEGERERWLGERAGAGGAAARAAGSAA